MFEDLIEQRKFKRKMGNIEKFKSSSLQSVLSANSINNKFVGATWWKHKECSPHEMEKKILVEK